jgi:PAS domain S-box-containing protein
MEASAGARLREEKDRILALWKQGVEQEVPAARKTATPALIDSLPGLLDRMAAALERGQHVDEERDHAIAHGKQRAKLGDYSLEQVVLEYQVLRQVLLEVLGAISTETRELLFDMILSAVRDAGGEFARLRDDERARAHAELAEANQDLDRRVRERLAELRFSETRFRHMVESVKDYAIFTIDPVGVITSWNMGCVRMKLYTVEEAIGRHFSMLYPEEGNRRDEPAAHLRAAAIEGRFRGEGIRVRKNGDLFLADVCITPLYEDKLIGFTKVVQDLTERNMLVQERDLTRSDLDRMRLEAQVRERFVATLTHDLRSPLSAAKSASELITRLPEKTDRVRVWAHRIGDALDRADRMISDLLDATSLQAGGKMHLQFERCDLREIAQDLCDELATRHGNRFVVQSEGSTVGVWNPDALRRVFDNLVSNAVKYGAAGTPISVRLRHINERMLIAVHNFGTIIPVEEQAKLFQPFHRARLAQESGKRGWGLGLTLVKGLIEALNGVIKVESYPREGTTFTIDLPMDATKRGSDEIGQTEKEGEQHPD